MIKTVKFFGLLAAMVFLTKVSIAQYSQPVYVDADHPVTEIQPTMWGIFFEDINFAADGGLYAELVKNRSFEFYKPRDGWITRVEDHDSSHLVIINRGATQDNNPRFARVKIDDANSKYCLSNTGFRGMGIHEGKSYRFSVLASLPNADVVSLRIELVNAKGEIIGQTRLQPAGKAWKKYSAELTASATDAKARLNIWFQGKGLIDIDMISLFPVDTWKNRPNGLRADLAQMLADMNPGFLRFPGGCIVEGWNLGVRYQWKKTIGDVEDRKMIINRWNTEFAHRLTPDYYQTFGLGFYEYFLLAEDLGAQPLPILNCGMACQFNSAEVVELDQLDPYIQDALDLIAFANGPADSEWGSIRAKMGHPESFKLKYLGIGNEQWGPQYFERYLLFEKAINEKYPDIVLVSGTGPQPDGDLFDYAVKALKNTKAEIVDEHYYRPPVWFRENANRYDNYDRKGYKVFAGEYAAQSVGTASPLNKNNWDCALSEAAFMTGLERNADIVVMCSYAPLFAHTDGWQWTPDLIWFDNLTSFGTPNYYVQQLFSVNKGTHALNMLRENEPLTGQSGVFASATLDQHTGEVILKLVNYAGQVSEVPVVLKTARRLLPGAIMTVLQHSDLDAMNSLQNPENIHPEERPLQLKGKKFSLALDPYSLTVVKIKLR